MCWRGVGLTVSHLHAMKLLGTAKVGTTQLSNLTVCSVCAKVWLAVAFMMCGIYILGIVSLWHSCRCCRVAGVTVV